MAAIEEIAQVGDANSPVPVTGIRLERIVDGDSWELRVLAEIEGSWRIVIEEIEDGPISHIVEPSGLRSAQSL